LIAWSWITDPDQDAKALLVRTALGPRLAWPTTVPTSGRWPPPVAGHLDDLFITPAARGTERWMHSWTALATTARQRGWNRIRWITGDDSHRARSKYDQVGEPTMWVTYDMQVRPAAD
jgi:hypothetical protein